MNLSYKTKLIIALGLVYVIWGSTFLATKVALKTLTPMLLIAIRFTVGGFGLLAFTFIKREALPTKKQLYNACFIGILLSGLGNGSLAFAIQFIPSGIVALFASAIPIWMFIINYLGFEKKKASKSGMIGLFLGFFGLVYLIDPMASLRQNIPIFPVLVVVFGSISWAYASVKTKDLDLPKSRLQSAGIQMFAAGIFALLGSLLIENGQILALQNTSISTIWAVGYMIFIGSYVGYLSFMWLVSNAPLSLVSTYAYVNPIVALILGWLFLGEPITPRTIMASAIILSGVMLITWRNSGDKNFRAR